MYVCAHSSTRGEREGTQRRGRHPMTTRWAVTCHSPQVCQEHKGASLRIIGTCCLSRTWPTLNPVIGPIAGIPVHPSLASSLLLISCVSPMHYALTATAGGVHTQNTHLALLIRTRGQPTSAPSGRRSDGRVGTRNRIVLLIWRLSAAIRRHSVRRPYI